jgi:hypothetical protein
MPRIHEYNMGVATPGIYMAKKKGIANCIKYVKAFYLKISMT